VGSMEEIISISRKNDLLLKALEKMLSKKMESTNFPSQDESTNYEKILEKNPDLLIYIHVSFDEEDFELLKKVGKELPETEIIVVTIDDNKPVENFYKRMKIGSCFSLDSDNSELYKKLTNYYEREKVIIYI
jgi:DNA-binding NarL/FixJ family response regulator